MVLLAITLLAGCGDDPNRPAEVDLLAGLSAAERRGPGLVDQSVRSDIVSVHGDARTSLVMRAPSRTSWLVTLPMHARLETALALMPDTATAAPQGVTVRVGLSDGRNYQEAATIAVTGTWQPITVDLRKYSEWKFSLFYQPLRKQWRLVFNADATPGGSAAWARPVLTRQDPK